MEDTVASLESDVSATVNSTSFLEMRLGEMEAEARGERTKALKEREINARAVKEVRWDFRYPHGFLLFSTDLD